MFNDARWPYFARVCPRAQRNYAVAMSGPKYDERPSAGECKPHKRINQKEDPSDFEDKYDPNHHWGHYTLEAFRDETAHDVV